MPEFGFLVKGFKRQKPKSRRDELDADPSGQVTSSTPPSFVAPGNSGQFTENTVKSGHLEVTTVAGAVQGRSGQDAAVPSSIGQALPGTIRRAVDPGIGNLSTGDDSALELVNASTHDDREGRSVTVITESLRNDEFTSNAPVDLLDIASSISKATDLRDPLRATSEALKKIFEIAKNMDSPGEEWMSPMRRLFFYHDTLESQNKHLEDDFEIDQTRPPPEPTVILFLEAELNKVHRMLCEIKISQSSVVNNNADGTPGDQTITNTIANMEEIFEEYTNALHDFAAQSIAQFTQEQAQSNREPPAAEAADNTPQRIWSSACSLSWGHAREDHRRY
ncbi:hypothetical protein M408DRAFT_30755 [Serendipita vermifera MAFF 305830]|uniref:Uncharacterized protein n=1 Tax=Serendipita vermifera MAFF 305830 TaxID=933852 RepID=A0A0C3A5N9_SERVB|nr:hypothetical protein M408DRAFT_30755 [Serendipita vermifera MAFF 305830]